MTTLTQKETSRRGAPMGTPTPGTSPETPPQSRPGENTDYASLIRALETPLLVHAVRLTGDPEVAQDLVAEALVRLGRRFKKVKHPRPWLFRTVGNLARGHGRRRRGRAAMGSPASDPGDDAVPPPADADLAHLESIGQAFLFLRSTDPHVREAIRLKYAEGCSFSEIGAATGLDPGQVGHLLRRALGALSDHLSAAPGR